MTASCRIGTVVSLPEVMLAELLGASLDLAWIDLEHSALGVRDVPGLAIGLKASGCEAHVRLRSSTDGDLGPVLDAGVDGVVVPAVASAADAVAFVRRLRYPPAGTRGFGPRRAGGYGRDLGQGATRIVRCTLQIESRAGVAAAEAIAAVDGVDCLVVGVTDLSLDLADPDAELGGVIAAVERAARGAGIAFGLAGGGDLERLAALAPPGTDLIVHSVDVRLYARAVDEATALLVDGLRAQRVGS